MPYWEHALKFNIEHIYPNQLTNLMQDLVSAPIFVPCDVLMPHLACRINTYLNQLAYDQITYGEFEAYLHDLKDLIRLAILKNEITDKQLLQRTIDVLNKLISDGLIPILTT